MADAFVTGVGGRGSLADKALSPATLTHSAVTVGATTTKVLDANTARKYVILVNDSDAVLYIKIGANAVMNEGIRINANGGSYEMSINLGNLGTGQVNAISQAGSKVLLVTEGV